jgi:endonuclease/exonuclease/phosphatase family metal-dependent hydrolase
MQSVNPTEARKSTDLPAPRPGGRDALWVVALLAVGVLSSAGFFGINRLLRVPMSETEGPQLLRIMTWNIGRLYLKWDSRAADSDLLHVAQVIRQARPHVVALQELRDPRQLGRLVAALGPGWRGRIPEDRWDRRAALVVRLPADFQSLPTSTGRTAQGAVIRLPSGRQMAVASLHLDAFDERRRMVQAQEILSSVRRIDDQNLILAGDFNFDPAIAARGSSDHELYRSLTSQLTDAAKGVGSTTLISRRLDYVFFRSPAVTGVRARVLHDKRIRVMDHDPVVVELSLNPKP